MSSLTPIQRSILKTVAYYDTFDYPLTSEEIWRWLYQEAETQATDRVATVRQEIDALVQMQRLVPIEGFFVFPNRESIVATRYERARENKRKWRRARTTARYLEMVPFVKMLAVVNTLAINNARKESDIDVLIVVRPGFLWLTRLLVTGAVHMLGYRRHGKKITDRICLSFYVTDDALDLGPLKSSDPDPHYTYWASQAVPLLNIDKTYEKFVEANQWVRQQLPNAFEWDWQEQVLLPNNGRGLIKKIYELALGNPIGGWINLAVRDPQLKRIEQNTTSRAKDDSTDVVISDQVLKFHEADRRKEYNRRFEDRLRELGLG